MEKFPVFQEYIFSFLLSSRIFVQPHELLGQLILDIVVVVNNTAIAGQDAIDQNAISSGDSEGCPGIATQEENGLSSPEQCLPALECLVKFLGVWTTKFPYDFRDERIMSHVKHIVAK